MSRGLNKVQLIGNFGADPEMRYMPSGAAVVNFTLATGEQWKDKETGDPMEKTEWHRVVAFQKLAEIVAEYCRKGSQVFVEGKLQTRKWQDKEGKDVYTTEIIANEVLMLGGRQQERPADRPQTTQQRPANSAARRPPANKAAPAQRPAAGGKRPPAKTTQPARQQLDQYQPGEREEIPFDDDIPFG